MLIQIKDGAPVGHPVLESNFRLLFAGLPEVITSDQAEALGFGLYRQVEKPSASVFETIEAGEICKGDDGVWSNTWIVKTLDDVNRANIESTKEEEIREERNRLLSSNIDTLNPIRWAALSTEQQEAWAAYRQDLLDLTDQSGFPFEVVWPTKPE